MFEPFQVKMCCLEFLFQKKISICMIRRFFYLATNTWFLGSLWAVFSIKEKTSRLNLHLMKLHTLKTTTVEILHAKCKESPK